MAAENKDTEKINALIRLAEFQGFRFDERRNHSWKLALGFWASITGSLAIINSITEFEINPFLVAILGLAVLLLHGFWLANVFEADKKDKFLAFEARDKAMKLLELSPLPLEIKDRRWYQD